MCSKNKKGRTTEGFCPKCGMPWGYMMENGMARNEYSLCVCQNQVDERDFTRQHTESLDYMVFQLNQEYWARRSERARERERYREMKEKEEEGAAS